MKAYGIGPMFVTSSDSPEHVGAAAHQLMQDGREPIIVPMGNGQYAAFDLGRGSQHPGRPSFRQPRSRTINGATPYTPDSWMSKMIGPQATNAGHEARARVHPSDGKKLARIRRQDRPLSELFGFRKVGKSRRPRRSAESRRILCRPLRTHSSPGTISSWPIC
jgi:hypothetical protein